MSRCRFLMSLVLAISVLMLQVGGVWAAPITQDSVKITGKVHRITIDTDPSTGIALVIVELVGAGQGKQVLRLSEETAISLGLVTLDVDGLVINEQALGAPMEIDPEMVIPDQEEDHHPVAIALATFFSGLADQDSIYGLIMDAHQAGVGFGVIAQALWLTSEIPGAGLEDFQALLQAKENGDYTGFLLEDGSTPQNWAQLRKAILEGKKVGNLGSVMSDRENNGGGNPDPGNKDKQKEKETGAGAGAGNSNKDKGKDKKK